MTVPWISRSRLFRELRIIGLSIGISVLVGFLSSIGKSHAIVRASLGHGAMIGVTIYLGITIAVHSAAATVRRWQPMPRAIALSTLFVVGGVVGWAAGVILGNLVYGDLIPINYFFGGTGRLFMIVTASIVLATSFIFRAFEALQIRLNETLVAEQELVVARSIQARLLPPPHIEGSGFAVSARNLPAHYVAGDFYDVVKLEDGSVVIVVADVAGKGVGASLIMASVKATLPFVIESRVSEAMTQLNRRLVESLQKREFVALTMARYYPASRSLHLVNAGMPDPYLIDSAGGGMLIAPGAHLPLGVRLDIAYETLETELQSGDRVLFLSDGVPEAPVKGDQLLGYEEVARIVRTMSEGSLRGEAWLDAFLARVRREVAPGLDDDWTALILETK